MLAASLDFGYHTPFAEGLYKFPRNLIHNSLNMHPFLTIADQAARTAGQVIIRALDRLNRLKIYEKKPYDFVTEIDQRVEAILVEAISRHYPHHSILAEEGSKYSRTGDYTWILDPLDGTVNFIRGLPFFAISIGIQYKGTLELGLIYDPIRQESFYAERGRGAFFQQTRLRVGSRAQLKEALLYIPHPPRDPEQLTHYVQSVQPLISESVGVRHLGSAALGLAYVAAGRLDGFWSFGLKPWNIAAGALLLLEAGGLVYDQQGGKNYLETGTIIGSNPQLCKYLLQAVHKSTLTKKS